MPEVFEVPGGYLFGKTKTVSTVISVRWRKNTRVRVRVGVGVRVRVVCFSLQVMYLTNLSVINLLYFLVLRLRGHGYDLTPILGIKCKPIPGSP